MAGTLKLLNWARLPGILLLWVAAVGVTQAAYVVTPQGQTIQGSDIRSRANGDIVLTTDKGPLTFTKGPTFVPWRMNPPNIGRRSNWRRLRNMMNRSSC